MRAVAAQDLGPSHTWDPDQRTTCRGRGPCRPGHWEVDLLIGLERSAIGTVVERTTRFSMLVHLPREEGYHHKKTPRKGPALAGYGAITMKAALTTTSNEDLAQLAGWRDTNATDAEEARTDRQSASTKQSAPDTSMALSEGGLDLRDLADRTVDLIRPSRSEPRASSVVILEHGPEVRAHVREDPTRRSALSSRHGVSNCHAAKDRPPTRNRFLANFPVDGRLHGRFGL